MPNEGWIRRGSFARPRHCARRTDRTAWRTPPWQTGSRAGTSASTRQDDPQTAMTIPAMASVQNHDDAPADRRGVGGVVGTHHRGDEQQPRDHGQGLNPIPSSIPRRSGGHRTVHRWLQLSDRRGLRRPRAGAGSGTGSIAGSASAAGSRSVTGGIAGPMIGSASGDDFGAAGGFVIRNSRPLGDLM